MFKLPGLMVEHVVAVQADLNHAWDKGNHTYSHYAKIIALEAKAQLLKGVLWATTGKSMAEVLTEIEQKEHFRQKITESESSNLFYKTYNNVSLKPSQSNSIKYSAKFFEDLEKEIQEFLDNPSITGNKKNAIQQIRNFIENESQGKEPKELELNANFLNALPWKIIVKLEGLKKLNLSCNSLTSLPIELRTLTGLTDLDISANKLRFVPSHIGELKNLKTLTLHTNLIASIPKEIENLKSLTLLNLNSNRLRLLPTAIGNCTSLTDLMLCVNELEFLPTEIGRLTNLNHLTLIGNQLINIPREIGQLTLLKDLYLSFNRLSSLPTEMGLLTSLRSLYLNANQNLTELPLTLASLSNLTEINIDKTQIDLLTCDGFLDLNFAEGANGSLIALSKRLDIWEKFAKSSKDLKRRVALLNENQKRTLNEWLMRLERTKDYDKAQEFLAKRICEMLETIFKNKEFQELFFIQADANNNCCEDRAAMALNELYTSWKIVLLPIKAPTKEKLGLLTRVSKTLALRNAISERIIDEQNKKYQKYLENYYRLRPSDQTFDEDKEAIFQIKKASLEREAAEIYLFYETELGRKKSKEEKKCGAFELDLESAVHTMYYSKIGKREWIIPGELVKEVESNYFNILWQLPIFTKLLPQKHKKKWKSIDEQYQVLCAAETDSAARTKLLRQRSLAKAKIAKRWYEAHLTCE